MSAGQGTELTPSADRPLVSVIIPHYQRFSLLKEAIDSVAAQTVPDWELIAVDDGSPQAAGQAFLREARERYRGRIAADRLRFVRIPHCGHPGAVRNEGAHHAKGRYLAFLDSDDLWLPDKLHHQLKWMEDHPDRKWSHTREEWRRGDRVLSQSKQHHRREGDIFSDSLQKCIIGPSTVLIQRLFFESGQGFDESIEVGEDYELWLRLLSSEPIGYLEEALTVKRAGEWNQLSSKYEEITSFHLAALEKYIQWAAEKPELREKRCLAVIQFQKKAAIYGNGCRKRGKTAEAELWQEKAAALGNNLEKQADPFGGGGDESPAY